METLLLITTTIIAIAFTFKLVAAYLMVYTYIHSEVDKYLEINNINISTKEKLDIVEKIKTKYKTEESQAFKISMFKLDLKKEDLPVIEKKFNMDNKVKFYLKQYNFPNNA